jgi:hypothetical protein
MTDDELKQRFAELDEELPAGAFTSRVMDGLMKPRRRERWLWSCATLSTFAFLWFAFPYLQAGLGIVAEIPRTLSGVAREAFPALSQSPLVYVYGTALGGYALLRLMRRLQVRWI